MMTGQIGNMDYIRPIPVVQDLQAVTAEEWLQLFEQIVEKSIYEVLILDLGDSVNGLFSILENVILFIRFRSKSRQQRQSCSSIRRIFCGPDMRNPGAYGTEGGKVEKRRYCHMRNTERLYDRVIEKMDMTCDMEDEELQELIHEVLEEASKEEFIPLQEKIRISKELFNAFRKLDILQELIEDDEITEIMINGTDHIFLEKRGVFLSQIADLCQLQSWKM